MTRPFSFPPSLFLSQTLIDRTYSIEFATRKLRVPYLLSPPFRQKRYNNTSKWARYFFRRTCGTKVSSQNLRQTNSSRRGAFRAFENLRVTRFLALSGSRTTRFRRKSVPRHFRITKRRDREIGGRGRERERERNNVARTCQINIAGRATGEICDSRTTPVAASERMS